MIVRTVVAKCDLDKLEQDQSCDRTQDLDPYGTQPNLELFGLGWSFKHTDNETLTICPAHTKLLAAAKARQPRLSTEEILNTGRKS